MTPAEVARFRAMLREQTDAAKGRDKLLARLRPPAAVETSKFAVAPGVSNGRVRTRDAVAPPRPIDAERPAAAPPTTLSPPAPAPAREVDVLELSGREIVAPRPRAAPAKAAAVAETPTFGRRDEEERVVRRAAPTVVSEDVPAAETTEPPPPAAAEPIAPPEPEPEPEPVDVIESAEPETCARQDDEPDDADAPTSGRPEGVIVVLKPPSPVYPAAAPDLTDRVARVNAVIDLKHFAERHRPSRPGSDAAALMRDLHEVLLAERGIVEMWLMVARTGY